MTSVAFLFTYFFLNLFTYARGARTHTHTELFLLGSTLIMSLWLCTLPLAAAKMQRVSLIYAPRACFSWIVVFSRSRVVEALAAPACAKCETPPDEPGVILSHTCDWCSPSLFHLAASKRFTEMFSWVHILTNGFLRITHLTHNGFQYYCEYWHGYYVFVGPKWKREIFEVRNSDVFTEANWFVSMLIIAQWTSAGTRAPCAAGRRWARTTDSGCVASALPRCTDWITQDTSKQKSAAEILQWTNSLSCNSFKQ